MDIKLTKQGQVIYDLIQDSSGHMTADEIHSQLKKQENKIGIATVYRNLNTLYDQKLINRVRHPELGYIYDKNTHEHYHFRCVVCDRITDVEIQPMDSTHEIVSKALGALVLSHDMSFEGICKDCRSKVDKEA